MELVGRDPSRDGGKLGIERGDIVEVTGPGGKVRAPAYLYLGIRPDTIALAIGQGHAPWRSSTHSSRSTPTRAPIQWGYGRYARDIGARAHDLIARTDRSRRWARARVARRSTLSKTGDHETLVSTEGSARQHGRGIAQALTVTQLAGCSSERR